MIDANKLADEIEEVLKSPAPCLDRTGDIVIAAPKKEWEFIIKTLRECVK